MILSLTEKGALEEDQVFGGDERELSNVEYEVSSGIMQEKYHTGNIVKGSGAQKSSLDCSY